MLYADQIMAEINTLPANRVEEILDYVKFIKQRETEKTKYTILSKEDALSMASDVIEEYRPALEDLAK